MKGTEKIMELISDEVEDLSKKDYIAFLAGLIFDLEVMKESAELELDEENTDNDE